MRFGHSYFLYFTWVFLVVLVLFFIWTFKARKKMLNSFADPEFIPDLASSVDHRLRKIKSILLIFGLVLIFFSLVRPQWGFHWEEVKRRGLDIIIAIDVSKSMLAEDVKPNRLERSKLAVKDLIHKLQGDRIGLIAFAGSSFLQCPLTIDYSGFVLSLDSLNHTTIPRGGTSLARAIKDAIDSFKGGVKQYKVLVLITDGESHEGDTLEWAEKAKNEGIKIFCIGIGTSDGELIPYRDETGRLSYVKDAEGNVVKSRLDEATLQKIALTTGGSYVRATGAEFGLDLIYQEKLSKMEKRDLDSKMSKQYEERFQVFLVAGVLCLILESLIGTRKRNGAV